MRDESHTCYSFANFRLDAAERLLFDGQRAIQLPPKAFDTLLVFVRNGGHVMTKERLLQEIWEGAFVEENNLAQNISTLRKILGEDKDKKFIETVPKFGYRFVAPVHDGSRNPGFEPGAVESAGARRYVSSADGPLDPAMSAPTLVLPATPPETKYAHNGDVNIAYQVVGEGPVDIVFVMGWVSHLEYFWKHHTFASFLQKIASFSRLILFDKRGTGLSDRVPINELPTLEQRMEDVHAVMDAVGSERAVLFGVSEGGPMCALFSATYPERTRALVMFGTYAKRIKDDNYPWAPSIEQREAFFELMKRGWGQPVGIEERAPSRASEPEFRKWWAEYLRMGASPGAAVALTKMNAEIDVRHVLPHVRIPTLVIHRSGDICLKVEEGRYVASLIPASKYVELPGNDHLPFVGDQAAIIYEIEKFVAGLGLDGGRDRVLATVMNIKIISAGAEAQRRGIPDWNDLFNRSREYVRRQLELYKGRLISYDEGGIQAVFDGPARAIRCAVAITESAGRLRVAVKTGVHTGECDVSDGEYGGYAVQLAERIAGDAPERKVIVSRTVKDLVAGSGLKFSECGTKTFDGVEGEWSLFEVVE